MRVPLYSAASYAAQMSELDYAITQEQMKAMYSWAVQDSRYHANVLGNWEYTPAEELLHRLNTRLQGKDPGLPINTRYWRNL